MTGIRLVISDVDGTLVTTDKTLTANSRAAIARLAAAGIGFSVISSRPPFGLRSLAAELGLRLPFGAFNGGALVLPDFTLVDQHVLSREAAVGAVTTFRASGVDVWAFTADRWILDNPQAPYVDLETRTIGSEPSLVDRLEGHLDGVMKVIGVSDNFGKLDACEPVLRRMLGEQATVARSQRYYLDVTPPGVDKGTCVAAIRRRTGVTMPEIATLGDMENDIPMFRQSGFSIAMGNASLAVKQCAVTSTRSNDEDGVAAAIDDLILTRATNDTADLKER